MRFLTETEAAVTASAAAGGVDAFRGRPGRFAGAPRASMALFNLSLSKIRRVTICSVAIYAKSITSAHQTSNVKQPTSRTISHLGLVCPARPPSVGEPLDRPLLFGGSSFKRGATGGRSSYQKWTAIRSRPTWKTTVEGSGSRGLTEGGLAGKFSTFVFFI